jgi:hypothetical protein
MTGRVTFVAFSAYRSLSSSDIGEDSLSSTKIVSEPGIYCQIKTRDYEDCVPRIWSIEDAANHADSRLK